MCVRPHWHDTTGCSVSGNLDCALMAVGSCRQSVPADHHHSGQRAATLVRLAVGGVGQHAGLEGHEEGREQGGLKTFQLHGSVVHAAGLYRHFTLEGGFDMEVEQEVGERDSGAIRPQLNTARRICLRVNVTASQVVIWDLKRTKRQTKSMTCAAACSFTGCIV